MKDVKDREIAVGLGVTEFQVQCARAVYGSRNHKAELTTIAAKTGKTALNVSSAMRSFHKKGLADQEESSVRINWFLTGTLLSTMEDEFRNSR